MCPSARPAIALLLLLLTAPPLWPAARVERVLARRSREGAVSRLEPEGALDGGPGGTLVVWTEVDRRSGPRLVGIRLDAGLEPVGPDLVLATGPVGQPAVALGRGGDALVAFAGESGGGPAIVVRRIPRLGSPGPAVALRGTTGGRPGFPSAAVDGGTGAGVVVWTEWRPAGDPGVFAARVTGSGAAGEVRRLGTGWAGERMRHATVAALAGGGAAVAWSRHREDGEAAGIWGLRLDGSGEPVGEQRLLVPADSALGPPIEPHLSALPTGGFVLTWMARRVDGYVPVVGLFDATMRGSVDPRATDPGGWLSGARAVVSPGGEPWLVVDRELAGEAEILALGPGGGLRRLTDPAVEVARLGVQLSGRQAVWLDEQRLAFLARREEADGGSLVLVVDRPADAPVAEAVAEGLREPGVAVPEPRVVETRAKDPGFVGHPHPGPAFSGFSADVTLGVGPEHLVAAVNLRIRFLTKAGEVTYDADIHDFFSAYATTPSVHFSGEPQIWDPAVLYDPHAERFVVSCLYTDQSLLVAVSDDSDPNGAWVVGRQDTSGFNTFVDFPNLGFDSEAWYVTPQFVEPPRAVWAFVVDKRKLLKQEKVKFRPRQVDTRQTLSSGTRVYDEGAPYVWMRYRSPAYTSFVLQAITGAPKRPKVHETTVEVPAWGYQQDVPQGGTSERLRVITTPPPRNSVVRDGSLWLAHGVRPDPAVDQMTIRWYEIGLHGWPESGEEPELLQLGDIDLGKKGGEPVSAFIANLEVDEEGNVAFVFAGSGLNQLITVYRAFRGADDPPGTVRGIRTWKRSSSPATTLYSDYAGMQIDPDDPTRVWGHAEYFVDTWEWATWVGSFALGDEASR